MTYPIRESFNTSNNNKLCTDSFPDVNCVPLPLINDQMLLLARLKAREILQSRTVGDTQLPSYTDALKNVIPSQYTSKLLS